jgi:hypothetical protein
MDTGDAAMKRVMGYLFTGLIGTTAGFIFLANTIVGA